MDATLFPRHDIDPKLKNREWRLKVAKAIWQNWGIANPEASIFYSKRARYSEIRDYALSKQSNGRYIKRITSEDQPETSFANIDTSIDPIIKTHRQKILGRIKKTAFNIMATPIDSVAKDKADDFFAEKKAKLMLRQAMQETDPELAKSPILAPEPGDPEDLEELEMMIQFSPKFIRAKDAEQAIALVMNENSFSHMDDLADEDLVDFGAKIYYENTNNDHRVLLKRIHPGQFLCSYSDDGNFDDLSYAGHWELVSLGALAKYFDDIELEEIANLCRNNYGNPSEIPNNTEFMRGTDVFKVPVFHFEYKSYDIKVTEERVNKRGNLKFGLADFAKFNKQKTSYTGNGEIPKYDKKEYETMYNGSWIVGTNFIYNDGKAPNQKRAMDPKKLTKTWSSYHVVTASFDKMCAKGITEDLIPIADEVQLTLWKLRQLNNSFIPLGIYIDFTSLEGVALGKGGAALTPRENLDMFFQLGVLGFRSDLISQDGKNQRKPMDYLNIQYLDKFNALWLNYQNNVQRMYELSGLNQTTDSATVDAKMLVGVANAQNAGTNNALYFIENAKRRMLEKLSRGILQRMQSALLSGPYEGYLQAIGSNTAEYLKFTAESLAYDYDLIIEDRPTDEQKQVLYNAMQKEIEAGNLSSVDVITISNSHSIKEAQMILSYRAEKKAREKQKQSLELQNANAKAQIESSKAAEEEKRKTLMLQHQFKMEQIDRMGIWDYLKNQQNANLDAAKALTEAGALPQAENTMPIPQQQQQQPPAIEQMQDQPQEEMMEMEQ